MIKKKLSIVETKTVNIKVGGENREPLRYCEKMLMDEAGTEDPTDITQARVVTTLLVAGYNALKGVKGEH